MKRLKLTLAPNYAGETVDQVAISVEIERAADALPITYTASVVGIPFAVFDGLALADDEGALPYSLEKASCDGVSFTELTEVRPTRTPVGSLRYSYTAYPRVLPENYRSSPYFDLRAEPFGINGAGVSFLILPSDGEYDVSLAWDMRRMPANARGVWSLAAGDRNMQIGVSTLRFSLYMAGVMNSDESGEFGIYWFGRPTFDVGAAAGRVRALFAYMTEFFHDDKPVYRVFLRRDPFERSGGGTALERSFISGYSAMGGTETEKWFAVLAHEMVHNWPSMDDEPAGVGTWYTEGMAEYYSALLPYKAGLASAEFTAREITDKAARYYESPLARMTNAELAKIYWTDRRAQPVPYGRGMVYLANTDVRLKRAGFEGIAEFARKYTRNAPITAQMWEAMLKSRLGDGALAEFAAMKAGETVVPDPECFDGAFDIIEREKLIDGNKQRVFEWRVRA